MMPRVAAASRLYGSPAAGSPAVLGMEVQSVAMPQVPVPYKPAVGGYRVGGALGSSPRRAEILAIHTNEVCSAAQGPAGHAVLMQVPVLCRGCNFHAQPTMPLSSCCCLDLMPNAEG
jgi:hypothetical protein